MAKLVSKKIITAEPVYDLAVEGNHNFYANGILVHNCATKSSTQGTNLLKLKAPFEVAATGTLLTNSPISMYVPLSWTENDRSTLTMFKSQYCEFGGFNDSQIVGYKNLDLLKEELDSCSLRRTLDQVRDSLPPKTVTYESLDMDDEHRRFYDAIADGVREEADKIDLKPANLLALTTRLRQATSCPSILTSQQIPATKLERCAELVEELASQGEKVVVFGTFKESIYELADMLRGKVKGSINTGDTPDDVFSADVERFQTDPKEQAFIGTFGKCSTGITLNAASYMIALDTPYTYSEFSQATDRIWRVTNQRPANVVVLSCADTIDERVAKIVGEKKDLSDYVIDDVPNERFSDQLKSMVLEA